MKEHEDWWERKLPAANGEVILHIKMK